jgi:hypothetical protein
VGNGGRQRISKGAFIISIPVKWHLWFLRGPLSASFEIMTDPQMAGDDGCFKNIEGRTIVDSGPRSVRSHQTGPKDRMKVAYIVSV